MSGATAVTSVSRESAGRILRFRAATGADIPEICHLFSAVFGVQMTPEIWRWKYHGLPGSDAINAVGCDANGTICAHMGAQVYPSDMVRGVPMHWLHGCDALVAPSARGSPSSGGAFGGVVRALQSQIDARYPGGMCYGFPGERPFRLGERLGFYVPQHRIELAALELDPWSRTRPGWRRLERVDCVAALATLDTPENGPGIQRTESYLKWRFDRHPTRSYMGWVWRLGWRRRAGLVVEEQRDSWDVVEVIGARALPAGIIGQLAQAAQRAGRALLRWDAAWTAVNVSVATTQPTGIVAVWIRSPADAGIPPPLRFQLADTDVF